MRIDPNLLFVPSKAIRKEKEFFAGRRDLILEALDEFETPGRSLVVYGERGVGKTSVAWQIYELASGDATLMRHWGIQDSPPQLDHKCVWLQCERNMGSIEGALLRLFLKSPDGVTFFDRFPRVFRRKKIFESLKQKYKIDLKVIGAELEALSKGVRTPNELSSELLDKEASIRALFNEVLAEIKDDDEYSESEIVIFFDEVDVLPVKRGIGSLIKETNSARFVVVGVFDNLEDVIEDHPSVVRKIARCVVPGLTNDEIDWIYNRAEGVYEGQLEFDQDFRSMVLNKAHGFPWLVQSFGHAGVKNALKSGRAKSGKLVVSKEHLHTSIDQLIQPRKEERTYASLREILESDKVAKHQVLRIAAATTGRVTLDEIRDQVDGTMKRWVEDNVDDLVKLGILKKDSQQRLRFEDPIARIIVQLHFEAVESKA